MSSLDGGREGVPRRHCRGRRLGPPALAAPGLRAFPERLAGASAAQRSRRSAARPHASRPGRDARYCIDLANACPRFAFEVWAPAQKGTAISAKARWESQTFLKKAFAAAFFSSDALAAFMYSLK